MTSWVVGVLPGFTLGVLASLLAAVIYDMARTTRQRPWASQRLLIWGPRPLRASVNGARDLDRLVVLLSGIRQWLATANNTLVTLMCEQVWLLINKLQVIKLGYVAIYAKGIEQQRWAIGQLGQIATPDARIMLGQIESNQLLDDLIRRLAREEIGKLN